MFGWKQLITRDKKNVIKCERQNMSKISNNLSILLQGGKSKVAIKILKSDKVPPEDLISL